MEKNKTLIWTTIVTAVTASLCCITPVLALLSGASGIASTFSWLEPFRPYLIIITILVLAFAWYQKFKHKVDCVCDEKPKFIQSKLFLSLITTFSFIMLAFPYYGKMFYPKTEKEIVIVESTNIETISIDIQGMTCTSCEEHVNYSVNKLNGILNITSSYKTGKTTIKFDNSKTSIQEIENAINSTGYKVTKQ